MEGKIWLRSAGDGFDCAYFWGVWMFLTFGRKLRLGMGIDGGTLVLFLVFLDYNGIQKRYTMKYRHCDGKLVLKVTDNREVNKSDSTLTLKSDCKEFQWESRESLLEMLELRGFVKQVFPLHDETKRKQLLRTWAFNCWDFTRQPIDEIYAYFGTKIATYFAFLGMFTRWILFPAIFGVTLQFVDLGSMQLLVLPAFFISITLWAVLFFQFWKRKNSALLTRWQISGPVAGGPGYKFSGVEWSSIQSPVEFMKKWGSYKTKEKEVFQREEWVGRLMRFRNDAFIILSTICLQLPFELAYAHLYEVIGSDLMKMIASSLTPRKKIGTGMAFLSFYGFVIIARIMMMWRRLYVVQVRR